MGICIKRQAGWRTAQQMNIGMNDVFIYNKRRLGFVEEPRKSGVSIQLSSPARITEEGVEEKGEVHASSRKHHLQHQQQQIQSYLRFNFFEVLLCC